MQFAGNILGIAQGIGKSVGNAGAQMTAARDAEHQAELIAQQTRFKARQERKKARRDVARGVAAAAAGGVDVSSGSPLAARLEAIKEGELQALDTEFKGEAMVNARNKEAARRRVGALGSLVDAATLGVGGGFVTGILTP